MAKISLNKLGLDKNTGVNKIKIGEVEVDVIQYLPVKEKIDLVEITINESMVGTYCSPILVDALFHTYLVLSYTNITLSPTQKENILETYDLLEKTGLIAEVIQAIPSEEYNSLKDSLCDCIDVAEKDANSVLSLIAEAIERMSGVVEDTKKKLSGLDLNSESIQTVLKIAKDNGAI